MINDSDKIDIVIPYVTQNDLRWQITCKRVSKKIGRPYIVNSQRFRSWDNLQFLFRGIAKFMPWVGTIHFVVCAETQIPEWLNRDTVHVVLHKDIIPRKYRPTFNSCCIEMFLKNIPGLREHFIYFNDDLFPISPFNETDFFTMGYPNLHYRKVYYSDSQNMFRHQCKAGLDMISQDFSVFCNGFLYKNTHSCVPMLKSTMDIVWEKHAPEILRRISRFREDKNINQYIYSYYQYMSGKFVDKIFPNMYACFINCDVDTVCSIITEQQTGVLCINDAGAEDNFNLYKQCLINAFNKILPERCRYEKSLSSL